jgi:hypothetical protein
MSAGAEPVFLARCGDSEPDRPAREGTRTMTGSRRRLLLCLLLSLATLLRLPTGHALAQATPEPSQAPPQFVLAPVGQSGTYFTLTADPGSKTKLTVALGNAGTESVKARTYAADAYTLINGGFGIKSEDEPSTGTTTWLGYHAKSLDLAPGQLVKRSFTVSIPKDTAPGQYITGIVLQTANPIAIGDSGMLKQTIAKAIAVFITVPGPVKPQLAIGKASLKQTEVATSLVVEIANPGNVLLKPEGTVTMTSAGGQPVLSAPVAMGSVYAGTATTLEIPVLTTVLAPGTYNVAVALQDKATGVHAEAPSLSVTVAASDTTKTPSPVTIGAVTLDPITDSATGKLQIVNVTVSLVNTGPAVPSARLTLHVVRDGQVVEDFPLNSSLVVPPGTTEIQQRYLPITGWTAGTYSFSVTLEAVDANSGQTTVLATAEAPTTVVVP